jgi:hypothetical protein
VQGVGEHLITIIKSWRETERDGKSGRACGERGIAENYDRTKEYKSRRRRW